jgi:rhodanese-related sulfurtransferase
VDLVVLVLLLVNVDQEREVVLVGPEALGGGKPGRARWKDGGVSNPSIPEVTVADIPADAVLLDVREADEWAAGRVPGAVHVPMTELAQRLDEVPDGDPVYVICRSGGRSARVTAYLNQQGWDSVNVAGGMGGWAAAGRPMVADGDAAPTVI